MKKLLYAVLFLVIFIFGLTFAARNPQRVAIDYYFGIDVELPITVLLLGSLVAGVVIGYVASFAGGMRRRLKRTGTARGNARAGTDMMPRSS